MVIDPAPPHKPPTGPARRRTRRAGLARLAAFGDARGLLAAVLSEFGRVPGGAAGYATKFTEYVCTKVWISKDAL